MKRLLFTIFLALCATAHAQTIRTLGYNSTNGYIVANSGTNVLRFTNDISFGGGPVVTADGFAYGQGTNIVISFETQTLAQAGQTVFEWQTNQFILSVPLKFNDANSATVTMRALSGSTNTNHPFSGSVSVVGTNNTNTLVFSNGILQSVQ